MTLAGTVATAGLLLERVITASAEGAALSMGHRRDINRRDDAGREKLVLQHVAATQLLDRYISVARRMGEGGELAPAPDPDVARLVAPARVEQRDVGHDGRNEQDRVFAGGDGYLPEGRCRL